MAQAGYTPISLYYSTTASTAPTSGNLVNGELAINITDGKLYYKDNGGTVQIIASKAGASGDVVGPASATDNAIVRFDGTTGKLVQNSVVTIADSTGDISGVGQLNATTLDATNIEVTNIKAKDGTAAASIADSTGVVSITANPVLSGGTANGVLYLNGSKVATSGSALTWDGTTLKVQNNNAVTPVFQIQSYASVGTGIANITYDQGTDIYKLSNPSTYGGSGIDFGTGASSTTRYHIDTSGIHVWTVASEAMRLTSTGLGIGTSSPANPLNIVKDNTAFRGQLSLQTVSASNFAQVTFYDQTTLSTQIYQGYGTDKSLNIVNALTHGIAFWTSNTQRMTLDASGNLLVGTTLNGAGARLKSKVAAGTFGLEVTDEVQSDFIVAPLSGAVCRVGPSAGAMAFYSANTERARITSGGDLLVGTTSTESGVRLWAANSAAAFNWVKSSNSLNAAYIGVRDTGEAQVSSTGAYPFTVYTNGSERARITSGGYFKASNSGSYVGSTGSYHEFVSNEGSATAAVYIRNTNASSPAGIDLSYSGASPNGTGNTFLYCQDSTALRTSIRSNGGLANYQSNNVDLSDARTKKDITPAPSYWNKIAALEIVTYKYNDQTHDDINVGVIAQQVESVEPVWVDADGFGKTPEDGVPLKTVYTKDITFAAIKALQEAMARIETLEAKVSALEGN